MGYILLRSGLLEHIIEGKTKGGKWREDKEEEVSSYWMTLKKRGDTGNWNRKHWIALHGELAWEEAMDLS